MAHKVLLKRGLLVACGLGLLGTSMAVPTAASADNGRPSAVAHTLLISVDGMHQSDLALYVRNHPSSNLAEATRDGVDYSNARTPFPSDSSPGMIGQTTGGNPKSTGFYYDDTWNHDVFPPGTTSCSAPPLAPRSPTTRPSTRTRGPWTPGKASSPPRAPTRGPISST